MAVCARGSVLVLCGICHGFFQLFFSPVMGGGGKRVVFQGRAQMITN